MKKKEDYALILGNVGVLWCEILQKNKGQNEIGEKCEIDGVLNFE
jgi:hypothetical protein